MPRVGAYEVSIVAYGYPLLDHNPPQDEDENDENKTITRVRYIQATEGQQFSIKIEIAPNTNFPTAYKSATIFVDGNRIDAFVIDPAKHGNRREGWVVWRTGRHNYENGAWVQRAFAFQNLVTTEASQAAKGLQEVARNAGRMEIKISDVTCVAGADLTQFAFTKAAPVPEKALKGQAIDTAVGYGKAEPVTVGSCFTVTTLGPDLACNVFKYRSRKALQMLDILPTTPEPQPLAERDIDTLNPQEMRRLLAEMREQAKVKHEAVKIKQENDISSRASKRQAATATDDNDEGDDCIIVEVKKRKVVKSEDQVLDLT